MAPKQIDRFCYAWCQSLAFFKLYMLHVNSLNIDQEKAMLWGIGCQSPPILPTCLKSVLAPKWVDQFFWLVTFAFIFKALYNTCQKIKNRSRKSQVMG